MIGRQTRIEHGGRPVTRRRAGVIASSPVLVGAITTLIVILAVFLAYNANNGLPFVPTYRLSALVPNANTLVKGNDVRIGGVRVGIVEKIEPVQDAETGEVYAKVDLKLDKTAEPVPKDSTVVVRSRSALGLKYLEIDKGTSSEGYAEGSTLPLEVAHPEPVEIDEFFNIFDGPTRRAAQGNLVAFGNALAGRGSGPERGLRRAAAPGHPPGAGGSQPRLAEDRGGALLPGARRQRGRGGAGRRDPGSDVRFPRVHLRRLRRGGAPLHPGVDLGGAAHLRHADPDGAADQELPGAQRHPVRRASSGHQGAERELAHGRGGVRDRRRRAARRPGAEPPGRAHGADAGGVRHRTPACRAGIRHSTQFFDLLNPALRFVGPAQTVCNYATLLARNAQDHLGISPDGIGTAQRFLVDVGRTETPSTGSTPRTARTARRPRPANSPTPAGGANNFLHANPYPNTASPGQTRASARRATSPTSPTRSWSATRPATRGS